VGTQTAAAAARPARSERGITGPAACTQAETTGDPEIEAIYREVRAQATTALGAILGGETGVAASAGPVAHEMAAELMRAGLAGLAIWWNDHPEVPREQVVATAINVLWIGLERVRRGEVRTA
jgi:hypothetical protein